MNGLRKGAAAALVAGLISLAAVVGPVAAAVPDNFVWTDAWTVQHACSVTESTSVTAREHDFFDGNGVWLRSLVQFDYVGTFSGPGGSLTVSDHQSGTFTPTTGTLSGQGIFLHGAGGVLVMDTGRLVFDLGSGTTLHQSAKVLGFDDGGLVDAALCARLG